MLTNADKIESRIAKTEYSEIYNLVKSLQKTYSSEEIFLGSAQWFSLQKIGHVDDKAYELFSELSSIASGVLLPKGNITVYRGCGGEDYVDNGFSWTLSKEVASWFATRMSHDSEPVVVKMVIDSRACIGFIDGPEREVLIHPEHIEAYELIDFDKGSKPDFASYINKVSNNG